MNFGELTKISKMKFEKILPFDTLLDYLEGKVNLPKSDQIQELLHQDVEAQELVEGLEAIYANEQLDREALESSFAKMELVIEEKIYSHKSFGNHLIDLNRQLRRAAALFILFFTFSFLVMEGLSNSNYERPQVYSGPYDLAMGSKIAP